MTETSLREERTRDPVAFSQELGEIRRALQLYLDEASLRQAAREVGMSPTGLSKFLDGAEPYARTVKKLRAWYTAQGVGMREPI